jgi:universal stress protein A
LQWRNPSPDRLGGVLSETRTRAAGGIKTILVPTDFSRPSREAVRYASALARDYGAALCVVFVYEPMMIVDGLESYAAVRSTEQVVRQVRAQLGAFVRDEIDELIPARSEVRVGKPYREIVASAKEVRADLIVIATHGYTGLKHAFIGSTAERVVRHASCPVLVVPQRQD